MPELQVTPDQMEVFVATAEVGGFEATLPAIWEHAGEDSRGILSKRARHIVSFREAVICEGRPIPSSIAVGLVTKGIISLEYDQDRIDKTRDDLDLLVKRYISSPHKRSLEVDPDLMPNLLLLETLVPSRHRVIELGQLASEAPELSGLDTSLRFERILAMHPFREPEL